MENGGGKKVPFTVGMSPDMTNINVKIKNVVECSRPSVQKKIHSAVQNYITRIVHRTGG